MKYAYYPGCSLKASGKAFEESLLAVCSALEIELAELDDWNCCGATAYMAVDETKGAALASRNLALAEQTGLDMAVPCAGCYGVLLKAQAMQRKYPRLADQVSVGLKAGGLTYGGRVRVKHPLEILAMDFGTKAFRSRVKVPLKGLRVACYYGCRLVRPESPFDDSHDPVTMDNLLKSVGARIVDYTLKSKCCGGSLTGTIPEVGQNLCYQLLKEAQRREADVVATACPLCQFNLECYQKDIARKYTDLKPIPVVYFTQLLGASLGLDPVALGFPRLIVPIEPILRERGIMAKAGTEPAKAGV